MRVGPFQVAEMGQKYVGLDTNDRFLHLTYRFLIILQLGCLVSTNDSYLKLSCSFPVSFAARLLRINT
jgi:hypothetical protein